MGKLATGRSNKITNCSQCSIFFNLNYSYNYLLPVSSQFPLPKTTSATRGADQAEGASVQKERKDGGGGYRHRPLPGLPERGAGVSERQHRLYQRQHRRLPGEHHADGGGQGEVVGGGGNPRNLIAWSSLCSINEGKVG